VQLSATVPLKPCRDERVIVSVADPPAALIVRLEALTVTPTLAPAPLKATVCGDPAASSVMVNVPVLLPATVGVKVTAMLQFRPAPRELPQVFVSAKSPVAVMEAIVRAA
jgi:hypothetical protein